jgi:hypothetical protein
VRGMKFLVGMEFSGVVRDAFNRGGHDAMSCDLLDTMSPGLHYKGNIFDVIDYPWDLAIFHPECTHTSVSGARHFAEKKMDGRQQRAVAFFFELERRSRHIPKRCFEHPISIMSRLFGKPTQIIHPWQFGHGETKATCLWLYGLSPLVPTNIVEGRVDRIHKMPPSPTRWMERSKTYLGIANAMTSQWNSP